MQNLQILQNPQTLQTLQNLQNLQNRTKIPRADLLLVKSAIQYTQSQFDKRNNNVFNLLALPIILSYVGSFNDIKSFKLVSKIFHKAYMLMKNGTRNDNTKIYDLELSERWNCNIRKNLIDNIFKNGRHSSFGICIIPIHKIGIPLLQLYNEKIRIKIPEKKYESLVHF